MYEDILAGLTLDKTIALAGVEPLHSSLFLHFFRPSLSSMSCLLFLAFSSRERLAPLTRTKMGCKFVPAAL
jgi:hypothetical protein